MYNKNLEETLLAEHLIEQVCDQASGALDEICLHNLPHDVYFIGNLRPFSTATTPNQPAHWRELENKLAPFAFGAEFLIEATGKSFGVNVKLDWSCFYRVLPTFNQQQSLQPSDEEDSNSPLPEDNPVVVVGDTRNISADVNLVEDDELIAEEEKVDGLAIAESPEIDETSVDRRQTRRASDSLFIAFRKIACEVEVELEFTQDKDGYWVTDDEKEKLDAVVRDEIEQARKQALADPECLRLTGDSWEKVRVPSSALKSEQAFKEFFEKGKPVVADWIWDIKLRIAPYGENMQLVHFSFGNSSPLQNPPEKSDSSKPLNPNLEPFFFNTESAFVFFDSEVKPFELDIAPRGFRYNRHFYGRGFNCAVETDEEKHVFLTTHAPISRQMRYTTQTDPPARFADLAENPLPVLQEILRAMEEYRHTWDAERTRYIVSQEGWEELYGEEFNRDKDKFLEEIESFRRGLSLIENDSDIRLAFQLLNETFRRVGDNPASYKDSWRLFQIVFVVSQIPGMAALKTTDPALIKEREQVDIIYFPTGGGKTEAYLGTLVFHCFFDRLRGKTAGVTAWTRFPLRLLTLQQTQRVADVIGNAELVRRENRDERLSGKGIASFAVGYFVGKEATPNEIYDTSKYSYSNSEGEQVWSQARDERARQAWKRLVSCPACRTKSVVVDFDDQGVRLLHVCTNKECPFPKGRIPVYVVDNETYRYLPCVLVGTIDKLAGVGNQRKMAQIFGQVDGKCAAHGYYKGKCCQKDCDNKALTPSIPPGLSGPTLFIQDELHLLSEGLGTFDSHYETFVQALLSQFGQRTPLKIMPHQPRSKHSNAKAGISINVLHRYSQGRVQL